MMLSSSYSFAAGTGAGGGGGGGGSASFAPIVLAGVKFYSGDSGKSLSGAMEYIVSFRAEKRKGIIRPTMAVDLGYSLGSASINADTPSFQMMSAGFLGGIHIFPSATGRLQPYLGGSGVLAWNYLRLPSPPSGIEPNTQGLALGYELCAGVDLRFGRIEGSALRIHGSLLTVTANLAGITNFQLTGFRLAVGMTY